MFRTHTAMTRCLGLFIVVACTGSSALGQQTDQATTPAWTHPTDFLAEEGSGDPLDWPQVRAEARPGAYWWWPGSAVTKEDLTWNLETYRQAGWGNMGVIGIYGVRGEEERFIDIFSPKWFEMFNHAVTQAERLGMNIDLTPGSGWRLGGPHVTPEYAEQSFAVTEKGIEAQTRRDRVKRAGPGGAGLDINPYSQAAVAIHLDWMDKRHRGGQGQSTARVLLRFVREPRQLVPGTARSVPATSRLFTGRTRRGPGRSRRRRKPPDAWSATTVKRSPTC